MSSWGRAQDRLSDLLWGYESSQMGDHHPGILEGKVPYDSIIDEQILEAIYPMIFEGGKRQQRYEDGRDE